MFTRVKTIFFLGIKTFCQQQIMLITNFKKKDVVALFKVLLMYCRVRCWQSFLPITHVTVASDMFCVL